jgi:AraC-like DNA-binding protein
VISRTPANTVGADSVDAFARGVGELVAIESCDAVIKRAIELARDRIGLVSASIYVMDRCRHLMFGTWGSDSSGAILDEHHVMYAVSRVDRAALRPDPEGAPYTVFEGCLMVEHRSRQTEVASPGWVACTPISCGEDVIGVMFNDAGPSHAALDEAKQARAVMLCSVLGVSLGSLSRASSAGSDRLPVHRLVMAAVAMLAQDPGVGVSHIAQQLAVSSRSLTRLFETTLGVSLGEYRNRVRLDQVAMLIAKGHTSLADAAIAAGFASYKQFLQISRMFRWKALLDRQSQQRRSRRPGSSERAPIVDGRRANT